MVNSHVPFWDCAIGTVGTEQILYGTDYPFGSPNSLAEGIRRIESLAISDAAKAAILSGTADRLLR
jgi:predicted TIM-barrel fold metal-dependent hydrolase